MRIHIYPHNELLNLARYHLGVMNDKLQSGNEDAVSLDALSCLIALAFSIEALVNFTGAKSVQNWKEKQPFHNKIQKVCQAIGINFDGQIEPFKLVESLKTIRDQIAHGKPFDGPVDVTSSTELKQAITPWGKYLTPTYINHAYEQVKAFQRILLHNSGVPIGATLTSAFGRRPGT